MQMLNETCFLMVSNAYFLFTDIVSNPMIKINCAWMIIVIVLLNLVYPNGYYMISGISLDLKRLCKNGTSLFNGKKRNMRNLERSRKDFVSKLDL